MLMLKKGSEKKYLMKLKVYPFSDPPSSPHRQHFCRYEEFFAYRFLDVHASVLRLIMK